jgi:WD40 repeat protein
MDIKDNLLFSGGTERVIKVWDRQTHNLLHCLPGHKDTICSIIHQQNLLFSGSDDRTIRVFSPPVFPLPSIPIYYPSSLLYNLFTSSLLSSSYSSASSLLPAA